MKKEIESLRREVARLKKLAYRDHLTGLLNRRGFEDSINLAINQHNSNLVRLTPRKGFIVKDVSLIAIDIDNFKKLNDMYGHPQGDQILKHLAAHVISHTRRTDLIARWGGEEILVGLIGADQNSAYMLAKKMLASLIEFNHKPRYTFSAGVASLNSEIKSFQKLYECADDALYLAKKAGRNRVVKCKISDKD